MPAAAAEAAQRPCLPGETVLVRLQDKFRYVRYTQQTPLILFTRIRRDKVDLAGRSPRLQAVHT